MAGSVLSVNVADVREIERNGSLVRTGIWKLPVEGRVALRDHRVEGDVQAGRDVHGGEHKAVYAYAREDTEWWEEELGRPLEHGTFGENLTTGGVDVSGALIGERWEVGSALLEVSEPRFPCWKLGVKMGDVRFPKRFAKAIRLGAYLRIVREGDVGAGDEVRLLSRPDRSITIAAFGEAYLHDRSRAARLLDAPRLSGDWRGWAERQLAR